MPSWNNEREAAVQAAKRAGELLLDWSGRFSVTRKGVNDLVTEADRAVQSAVRELLQRKFPSDDFLGEEDDGGPRTSSDRRWIVDPLDGTTNYVHGFPFFCTSIGLEVAGKLAVGVIYDPTHRELFVATAGGGAFCNGVGLHASRSEKVSDALFSAGLPCDLVKYSRSLQILTHISQRARSVRRLGSAALSLAYIAAGRLDGYWEEKLHPWDCAAGVLLIQEAGGRVTNLDQSPFNLYTPDILATNGLVHAELASEIAALS